MSASKPFADTRLPAFLEKRILALRPTRTQAEIAAQAGFINPNMISLIKSGTVRLPLDRVPAMAEALEVDPARLLQLALEQWAGSAAAQAFATIYQTTVTRNEAGWLEAIREASDNKDPAITTRARSAIRAIFGK